MASKGKKVAFIEKEHLGGTCLNIGCTPTKTYVASARRMWDAQHGEELGVLIPEGATVDLQKVKARKDALIKKSVDGITGGVEKTEGFEDVDYLTNQSILQLESLPEHLIIVGGSYIGLEFGQMFRRFGCKVTIIERGSTIIKREDTEVSQHILSFLRAEGIEFRLNANCISGKQVDKIPIF